MRSLNNRGWMQKTGVILIPAKYSPEAGKKRQKTQYENQCQVEGWSGAFLTGRRAPLPYETAHSAFSPLHSSPPEKLLSWRGLGPARAMEACMDQEHRMPHLSVRPRLRSTRRMAPALACSQR